MIILGIETSCDETAAAIVKDGHIILDSSIDSQIDIHAQYGGVVPEIASRNHLIKINALIRSCISRAGLGIDQIDKIAVTAGPGLIGALLTGLASAKAISYITSKPLIPVNHIQAHLYSALMLPDQSGLFPCLSLLVSGGHTSILILKSITQMELIANTRDDAAGEAFDKVAQFLGLSYPGGPAVSKLALKGDPQSVPLPLPLASKKIMAFSFSGLKTAVMNHIKANPHVRPADVCASFEEAAVKHLLNKFEIAINKYKPASASLCGGVSANVRLRNRFVGLCSKKGLRSLIPPFNLCTDNAAMVAGLAYHLKEDPEYLKLNAYSSVDMQDLSNSNMKILSDKNILTSGR
jgi:N6-L-threonylcarbamoyladenine synthase